MTRVELATVVLAIVIGSAVSLYIRRVPEPLAPPEISAVGKAGSLNLLREPRELPDVGFSDGDGRPVKLSSYRGKVVLLNVWATWCPPCRKEMPSLDRLQAKLGGPEFEVVALSIDRGGPSVVRTFYEEIGLKSLRVYIDQNGEASLALGVNGVPATLLIDSEGKEIGRKIGPAEWDSPEVVTVIQGYLGASAPDQRVKRWKD